VTIGIVFFPLGAFLDSYRDRHTDADIETWDLWDGSLPTFGPPAAPRR